MSRTTTFQNGIIKSKQKRLARYNLRYFYTKHKHKKPKLTYVALDTNIIIDMEKIIRGTAPIKKSPQYFSSLHKLLDNSALTKNGKRNPNGHIVFCVLPSVYLELVDHDGHIFAPLKQFIENRTLIFKPNLATQKQLTKYSNKLAKEYKHNNLFIEQKSDAEELMMDAFVVAESAIFNINLISRDSDVTIDFSKKNPKYKIEKIKHINRKALAFLGENQAEVMRVDYFLDKFHKDVIMPRPANIELLSNGTQQFIYDLENNRQISMPYNDIDILSK